MRRIARRITVALIIAGAIAALAAMVTAVSDGTDNSLFIAKTSEFG